MKIMFVSDIHGSAYYCSRMLDIYRRSGAGRLVLLGDILYHGPRNDLPREYGPKEVIAMLNPGSVSIPKGGSPNTYAMLEDGVFAIFNLEGGVFKEIKL